MIFGLGPCFQVEIQLLHVCVCVCVHIYIIWKDAFVSWRDLIKDLNVRHAFLNVLLELRSFVY